MNRAAHRLIPLILLAGVASATAEPVATAPASLPATQPQAAPNLDQLLKDLASDDWQQRQQASNSLADLDPSDLPRLRKVIETTTDVDLRTAVLAAVKRIEEKALTSPTLITLHVKDAPATDVLDALGKQVNFDLVTDSADWFKDIKLSADADRQPFWMVMKQLSAQWPARILTPLTDPNRITLVAIGNNYLGDRSTVTGPFLICPVMLQSNSMVDLLQPVPQAKFRMVTLQLAVLVEPKLRASRLTVSVKEAVDENGKSVTATDPNMPVGVQMAMVSPASLMMVRLNPPVGVGKTIARLSGGVRCRIPTRTRPVELTDIADGREHTVDVNGRSIKALLVTTDKQYDVKLVMPNNVNIQDELSISLLRDMTLLDADGHALFRRSSAQGMNGRSWELTVSFVKEGNAFGKTIQRAGEPSKIVWDLAVESKDVESPFELTNIPLSQ